MSAGRIILVDMKNIDFEANLSFKTDLGWVTLFSRAEKIVQIEIIGSANKGPCGNRVIPNLSKAPILNQAKKQILDYLAGNLKSVTFPIDYQGTLFQEAVWKEVSRVKSGRTISYTQIAENIGNPGAARAVGTAVGSNPLPLAIPCHRVVTSGRGLSGYFAGEGVETQKQILEIENVKIR